MNIVLTASNLHVKPSSYLHNIGGYAAFSFDMAAAMALNYLREGKKPRFMATRINDLL